MRVSGKLGCRSEEGVLGEEPYVWTRHMSSAGLLPSW
jgi:hypothetical protein